MTKKDWNLLTRDDRLFRVAGLLGWHNVSMRYYDGAHERRVRLLGNRGMQTKDEPVPDYIRDLNAMAEAERTLMGTEDLRTRWQANMITACGDINTALVATADQRALAYALTVENV